MNLELVKKGQGKRARGIAYFLGGCLVLYGAIALYAFINKPGQWLLMDEPLPILGAVSWYKVIAAVVFGFGLLALHLFLNRASFVDLLIDTEQEMKKVSWPTRPEVQSASIVVIIVTIILALTLWGFDNGLQAVFKLVLGG